MEKYIDADKLIAEIERRIARLDKELKPAAEEDFVSSWASTAKNKRVALQSILSFITSLQQEQPEPTCKSCGFYENNCPFIRGKFMPYPNRVCKDYTYSVMKEQQQPEVDFIASAKKSK